MQATPPWFTVNVCPAMVSVPVREPAFPFAAMLKFTVPFPVPLALPLATVRNESFAVAVHAQVLNEAVTATAPRPPPASEETPSGVIANEQEEPNSVMVCGVLDGCPSIVPLIVTVVVRCCDGGLFAATVKLTLPSPVPLADDVRVTQESAGDAVQLQVGPAVTMILPLPPAVLKLDPAGLTV